MWNILSREFCRCFTQNRPSAVHIPKYTGLIKIHTQVWDTSRHLLDYLEEAFVTDDWQDVEMWTHSSRLSVCLSAYHTRARPNNGISVPSTYCTAHGLAELWRTSHPSTTTTHAVPDVYSGAGTLFPELSSQTLGYCSIMGDSNKIIKFLIV